MRTRGVGKGTGKNPQGKAWQEEPDNFPYKPRNRGEKGQKAAQCGKDEGQGMGNIGVYGAEEGDAENSGADAADDLGDLGLCAVEEVWGVSDRQTGANTPDDFPRGLIDFHTLKPWA